MNNAGSATTPLLVAGHPTAPFHTARPSLKKIIGTAAVVSVLALLVISAVAFTFPVTLCLAALSIVVIGATAYFAFRR